MRRNEIAGLPMTAMAAALVPAPATGDITAVVVSMAVNEIGSETATGIGSALAIVTAIPVLLVAASY